MRLTLTDDVRSTMVLLAGKGMPIRHMCWYCGIGERTYFDWMRKGDQGQEPYAAFVADIRKAQGQRGETLLDAAHAMAEEDPSMVRYLLSRMAPKQLGDDGAEQDHIEAGYAESTEDEVIEMFASDPKIQERVLEVLRAKRLEAGDDD